MHSSSAPISPFSPTRPRLVGGLLATGGMALIALDRSAPQAAVLVLAGVVGSVALLHGALDAVLLGRHGRSGAHALWLGTLYLLITLAAGAAALCWPAQALLGLLPLSVWHFGESFGIASRAPAWLRIVRRIARGGAPVMLPTLLSPHSMQHLLDAMGSPGDGASGLLWSSWQALALVWVLVVLVQSGSSAQRGELGAADRTVLHEIALLAALNLVLSPLLAFAAFFAVMHCAAHILRVLAADRGGVAGQRRRVSARWVWLTALLSLITTGAFGWFYSTVHASPVDGAALLPFLVAVLAAVSVPHAILVSHAASALPANALTPFNRPGLLHRRGQRGVHEPIAVRAQPALPMMRTGHEARVD